MSCPICAKPVDDTYRPFCSKRCADLDLAKWLNGSYAVPLEEEDAFSDDQGPVDTPQRRTH
ncbi:DNA gyrase inhibitor YacG [Marinovum sp.]|uniref:DNA gyrase inhibitor YacG n=1 Tax=Marinovum sp. TaxID=2024839 RepID=UPI002B26C8F6|nr:DNA gyrase inhibitor YacG [Marinovum sp.]